ncbi:MAG: TMEM165/GDT1 family protein [Hyphomonadaceae bacterium]|nr:TMEM165/GDT1 family protein [Clostridia bacterium]
MTALFIQAFITIFLAEMGDKSQLLALAFATKYKLRQVLFGLFIGILVNHAIAVVIGHFVHQAVEDLTLVKIFAAFAFILFGLMSLKQGHSDEEAAPQKVFFSPVWTVALAFFVGELGDKTQLATLALATTTEYPFVLLCATVSAMMTVGMIGIIIGAMAGKKMPEKFLKILSGAIFIFFGVLMLAQNMPKTQLDTVVMGILSLACAGFGAYLWLKKPKKV